MMLRSKVPGGAKVRQCAQIVARPFRAAVQERTEYPRLVLAEQYQHQDVLLPTQAGPV